MTSLLRAGKRWVGFVQLFHHPPKTDEQQTEGLCHGGAGAAALLPAAPLPLSAEPGRAQQR